MSRLPYKLYINELLYNSTYPCTSFDKIEHTILNVISSISKMTHSLFFSNIPREERLMIKYITIAYKDVARAYFPNCVIAVDPFYVIKHLPKVWGALE